MSLLGISQSEWQKAIQYFQDHQQQTKLKRDGIHFLHSFIKIDNEIYGMASGKLLGVGTNGKTKEGVSSTGERVAIKIQGRNFELINEEERILDILGYLRGKLDRPLGHFVKFWKNDFHSFMTNLKHYTVMKFFEGKDLSSALYANESQRTHNLIPKLTYLQKLMIAINICQALHHLQIHGIIHGDIKPQNIKLKMSDDNITVNLLDYGFSMTLGKGEHYIICNIVKGSEGYIAPEIYLGNMYSFESDIYALGKMFSKDFGFPSHLYEGMIKENSMERDDIDTVMQKLICERDRYRFDIFNDKTSRDNDMQFQLPSKVHGVLLFDVNNSRALKPKSKKRPDDCCFDSFDFSNLHEMIDFDPPFTGYCRNSS